MSIPSSTASVAGPLDGQIDSVFAVVAFIANRHLLDHMRRMAAQYAMDLETSYIYGTLAQLNVANTLVPGVDPRQVLTTDGLVHPAAFRPVRLTHLALIVGMPRETVRRKLEALRDQGRVERTASGRWQMTGEPLGPEQRLFTIDTVRRLLRAAQAIQQVIDDQAAAPSERQAG